MSQEKISEKYKNKEWLYNQYIEQNKTIKHIAKEFGYSKTTLSRYKDRFGLKKYKVKKNTKPYANKDWLYKKYIIENKLPIILTNSKSSSTGMVNYRFSYIIRFVFN